MKPTFQIDKITPEGNRTYIRAKLISGGSFSVGDGSRLDEYPLMCELHEPEQGTFIFTIDSNSINDDLKCGKTVTLYE